MIDKATEMQDELNSLSGMDQMGWAMDNHGKLEKISDEIQKIDDELDKLDKKKNWAYYKTGET